MTPENKLFLDTNRHHLDTIKGGAIKHLQVMRMYSVMIEEFNPKYGSFNEGDFDSVAKLVTDTFQFYDQWLESNAIKNTA